MRRSLSDQGNVFAVTKILGDPTPDPDVYWQGRWSNAPGVWVDLLTANSSIGVRNYAYGGRVLSQLAWLTGTQLRMSFCFTLLMHQQCVLYDMQVQRRASWPTFGTAGRCSGCCPA
jgi:hypothetical protein